ncbi:tripartite tricarboxylate transporter substrate binding protein [Azotobacter chroococcum subsp. isscasi]|uniref:Bug family tripartite tricarboxylate transporter substrate binding protein n=1 Tax=Azotobacter chroococcum TaxID=353 RepID=UPI00103EA8AD|nr:tripartite tricarboxylate transporter substrate-binding protein [Azotobacter chroococcum]TBW11873.1 tripartite tricarboxylate transporter substrate binding protein [Azotobacter chroococcum subsp. isscasi]
MFVSLRRFGALTVTALSLLATSALALDTAKFMVPGPSGGGYDQTARLLGKALIEAKAARAVTFENKGGAGGTLGLAQFANSTRGNPNALLIVGAVMVGAVVQNRPPITLEHVTPIARLFHEYNVIAVRSASPHKTLDDLLTEFKANPSSVKWAGGSKGSVDHIGIAELAGKLNIPIDKVNYIAFGGGGEAVAATLGGHVTAITGGYAELAKYIESGQFRVLAVGSPSRIAGVDAPTLKERGLDMTIDNWRGVYGAAGLTPAQRQEVTDAVLAATNTEAWKESLQANAWLPSVISGDDFAKFVEDEHSRLRDMLIKAGLL